MTPEVWIELRKAEANRPTYESTHLSGSLQPQNMEMLLGQSVLMTLIIVLKFMVMLLVGIGDGI